MRLRHEELQYQANKRYRHLRIIKIVPVREVVREYSTDQRPDNKPEKWCNAVCRNPSVTIFLRPNSCYDGAANSEGCSEEHTRQEAKWQEYRYAWGEGAWNGQQDANEERGERHPFTAVHFRDR